MVRGLEHMEYDLKMRKHETNNLGEGEGERIGFDLFSSTT